MNIKKGKIYTNQLAPHSQYPFILLKLIVQCCSLIRCQYLKILTPCINKLQKTYYISHYTSFTENLVIQKVQN